MDTPKLHEQFSAGERKVNEYVNRILKGESKESILKDLPSFFVSGIEKGLAARQKPEQTILSETSVDVPPQYKGLDTKTLLEIWTIPVYIDPEKTKRLQAEKMRVIAALRTQESKQQKAGEQALAEQAQIAQTKQELGIAPTTFDRIPDMEARKKLTGWDASYTLANVARQQGVNLSKISREAYVDFAIQNNLAIDDAQLRVAPWQRMATSALEIVSENKLRRAQIQPDVDKAFAKFSYEISKRAEGDDRMIENGIRIRKGTKDSNSWLFFGINNHTGGGTETYKSYISFKDLNTLTPDRFTQFITALRDAGYHGDIKIFQDLIDMGIKLNDQIVMHGGTKADADLALRVAETFFGSDLDQKNVGKDEVINGVNKSYSQILAMKIANAINPPKMKQAA